MGFHIRVRLFHRFGKRIRVRVLRSCWDDPGRRFPFGLPRTDNANYLWIQLFYSALNRKGRAGFIMANSASDARSSEQELRQQLIEARAVDVMFAVGPNLFYTVTLPCTLWFLDKGKRKTPRADTVLFLDSRHNLPPGRPRPPRMDSRQGWGAKVIDRLAVDLQREFPNSPDTPPATENSWLRVLTFIVFRRQSTT